MTFNCMNCGSDHMRVKGYKETKQGKTKQFQCKECGSYNTFRLDQEETQEKPPKALPIQQAIDLEHDYDGIMVTSCLNDTDIFKPFFNNLVAYCNYHNYRLLVIKNKYLNPSALNKDGDVTWPKECIPYFLNTTLYYKNKFKVIGGCNIQATASHPLTGIDGLSEGITTIVGHPVVQMKSLPVSRGKDSVILHSTGSISKKNNYSASKAGYRASFHHSYAAVVVEIDKETDNFFVRNLSADKTGTFHDLAEKWEDGHLSFSDVEAIYLGDEHVVFRDKNVTEATFGADGIVGALQPNFIIRGDSLDSFAVSHHHRDNFFSRWKKHQVTNKGNIRDELDETLAYIYETTPSYATSLMITGNHEEHLDKWLNIADPKQDLVNAELYHQLMHLKLKEIRECGKRTAFELYRDEIYAQKHGNDGNVISCPEGYTILGINVSMHGDLGPNGARGSAQNLSKIGEKVIIGHSHQPSILSGLYCVGTASVMDLEYARGPSSWLHTHCLIHKNGKRQLVTIINGKWTTRV
jgi:hypothetical protein